MWNRKQVPHWVPEFHRYSKTINNTHKTHKQHSMPLQYSTFTHIPVSKTHSPPDPLSKGQQKVPDHSPNWPGAINQQNTPVLALIPHSYQHPQLPTLTQDSFPLGGSWWPWIPQGPNPPFVHQVLRMQQFAVSLDFPNLHNPDHWHKGSWMMTDPVLHVDFPLLLSLNLLHCRQEKVFQCFNLRKQYFEKHCWVKNYVKMIIQVIAPVALVLKTKPITKVYYFLETSCLNNGCKDYLWENALYALN